MFVRDFMTPDPLTITPETSHPDAVALMREHHIRRLPVMSKAKLVGIVSEQDLLSNQPSPASTLSVYEIYSLMGRLQAKDFMVHPVVTVQGDCPIEDAACIMVNKKIGCLPVLGDGRLDGIITETDIFRALVDVLGGGKGKGLRVVVRGVPEHVGELAKLTGDIASIGGNIMAITTSESLGAETIKLTGVSEAALKGLLEKRGLEVVDLRPFTTYAPLMCE
jgi:acetoin utilization protein AcuB